MANEEMIRKVIAQMEADGPTRPRWDQAAWVAFQTEDERSYIDPEKYGEPGPTNLCGTFMCFAGYTMWTHLGPEGFFLRYLTAEYRWVAGGENRPQPRRKLFVWNMSRVEDIPRKARTLLDLSEYQEAQLFASSPLLADGRWVTTIQEFKELVEQVTDIDLSSESEVSE
jgi:hypothetical protein